MGEILGKFKKFNKGKQFQIIFSILFTLIAVGVVILNIIGIWEIPNNYLLSIIIVLLCSIVVIFIVEEMDVFEEIRNKTHECSEKLEEIEDKKESRLQEIQNKIESVGRDLEDVHKLVKDTHTTKGVIASRTELEKNRSLDEVWRGADEICLLAIANTSFLRGNGIYKIKEAINRGVKFKLVSLNPSYDAIQEYEESGIISPTSLPVGENVNAYIANCTGSNNGRNRRKDADVFRNMVELRLTTYLLPYSMMIVKKNEKISTIKIDLYGLDMDYTERRSFYIPVEDEENIKFYEEQWNAVWNDKEKTVPVDLSKSYI